MTISPHRGLGGDNREVSSRNNLLHNGLWWSSKDLPVRLSNPRGIVIHEARPGYWTLAGRRVINTSQQDPRRLHRAPIATSMGASVAGDSAGPGRSAGGSCAEVGISDCTHVICEIFANVATIVASTTLPPKTSTSGSGFRATASDLMIA